MPRKSAHVLVIGPHPDDPEFGAGGTVACWARQGKKIVYVICTNGDKGTSDVNMTSEKLIKIREKEQRAAAKVLGVQEVVFLGFPDQGLEDTPEFRKALVRVIRMYRPDMVMTCDPYRRYIWHRDHRITGQVVLDAIFPFSRDRLAYPDLLEQGLNPHKVKEILFWGSDEPNYCVDITETYQLKIKAVRCHKSQVGGRASGLEKRMRERHAAMAEGEPFELAEGFHRVEIQM